MKQTINFNEFYLFKHTLLTENHLLFSFCHFLSASIDYWDKKYVDLPIKELFHDKIFTAEHFTLIVGTFEFHHRVSIPEDYLDYNLTIRQFIDKVAMLPKLDTNTYYARVIDITNAMRNNNNK
jgi:hypothetical protein